jgi:hypothetical protein
MRPATVLLLLLAVPAQAQAAEGGRGVKRALIVCGLPGDDEHRSLYADAVLSLHKSLTGRYGFPASEVLVRFGDGKGLSVSRGPADRAGVEAEVAELRRRLGPDDALWVVVVGHCHYDGRHSHLNLPGPDPDERAFGKVFEGLKAKEQVFFITTSASGFFLKPLAAPGRVVITATEPDREVNETLFPLALAALLADPPEGIDRDKDGSVSLLELYLAVAADVMKRYVDDEALPTEHARLDDNGDGHGSELQEGYLPPELGGRAGKRPEPKIRPNDDGALASKIIVAPAPGGKPPSSSHLPSNGSVGGAHFPRNFEPRRSSNDEPAIELQIGPDDGSLSHRGLRRPAR